jgi:hypothetical protein
VQVQRVHDLFSKEYGFDVKQHTITYDEEETPQLQVNHYVHNFVYEYRKSHTLLIIYYAGHGYYSEGSMKLLA